MLAHYSYKFPDQILSMTSVTNISTNEPTIVTAINKPDEEYVDIIKCQHGQSFLYVATVHGYILNCEGHYTAIADMMDGSIRFA